jgi:hypothetical protein
MTITRRSFGRLSAGAVMGVAAPAVLSGAYAQGKPIRIGYSASRSKTCWCRLTI